MDPEGKYVSDFLQNSESTVISAESALKLGFLYPKP